MIFQPVNHKITYEYCLQFVGKKIKKWFIDEIFVRDRRIRFKMTCDCGRKSDSIAYRLFTNLTSSCVSCGAKKHGKFRTSTWRSWNGAKNRCNNKNNKDYDNYGARGIKFSPLWNKFEDFLRDMGEKPVGLTLDRINNDGNYEPGNCRWATISQQNSNQRKRKSLNKGVNL